MKPFYITLNNLFKKFFDLLKKKRILFLATNNSDLITIVFILYKMKSNTFMII